MSRVDFKIDQLVPCQCGFKPDHFDIGYGRTPYDIYCPVCKKQSSMAKCKITGSHLNLIDYWNKHVSKLTKEEMLKEVEEACEQRKKEDPYNEYKVYTYYWTKDEGEELIKRCQYVNER